MSNSSSESISEVRPVNCWQYSRDVYLIGRSYKFRYFTDAEREAIINFIVAMAETRPAYIPYINLKAGNPPCNKFVDSSNSSSASTSESSSASEGARSLVWDFLNKQNSYSLAKMVQKIGRSLKVQFCTQEEKELCDELFANTDRRRYLGYNNYVTDASNSSSASASASN